MNKTFNFIIMILLISIIGISYVKYNLSLGPNTFSNMGNGELYCAQTSGVCGDQSVISVTRLASFDGEPRDNEFDFEKFVKDAIAECNLKVDAAKQETFTCLGVASSTCAANCKFQFDVTDETSPCISNGYVWWTEFASYFYSYNNGILTYDYREDGPFMSQISRGASTTASDGKHYASYACVPTGS